MDGSWRAHTRSDKSWRERTRGVESGRAWSNLRNRKLTSEVRGDKGWRKWTKVGESRRRVTKIKEDFLIVEESGPKLEGVDERCRVLTRIDKNGCDLTSVYFDVSSKQRQNECKKMNCWFYRNSRRMKLRAIFKNCALGKINQFSSTFVHKRVFISLELHSFWIESESCMIWLNVCLLWRRIWWTNVVLLRLTTNNHFFPRTHFQTGLPDVLTFITYTTLN